MKKIGKLKLNQLSEANLRDREMNGLKGGVYCTCSCYYSGNGGSSSTSNMNANYGNGSGTKSNEGCNQYLKMDGYYFTGTGGDASNPSNYGVYLPG